MIGRNNADHITRTLDSTNEIFDLYCYHDTGSSDGTLELWEDWCEKHNQKCKTSKKELDEYNTVEVNGEQILGEFCAARNDSMKLLDDDVDYMFWMDTDDILINPEGVRKAAEILEREGKQVAIMEYVYAKGHGNIKPVTQKRERLIDVGEPGRWRNWVHEGYEFEGDDVGSIYIQDVVVEHERTPNQAIATGRRNHKIMKQQIEEQGVDEFPTHMLRNYAYDFWEHKEFDKALKYYKILLGRDLGALQRYNALCRVSNTYIMIGEHEKATPYAMRALKLSGKERSIRDKTYPHVLLAQVFDQTDQPEEALFHAEKALKLGKPEVAAPINEYEYIVIPRKLIVKNLLAIGEDKQALELAKEVASMTQDKRDLEQARAIADGVENREALVALDTMKRLYQTTGNKEELQRVLDVMPPTLRSDPTGAQIVKEIYHDLHKVDMYKTKGDKPVIVIYAGKQAIEPWHGHSDIEDGIGGSEGMCIQISRELVKLDYKVIIYNNCQDKEGKYDGVIYRDADKWDSSQNCDVFISLRRPDVFKKLIHARLQYLWLHDTGYGEVPKTMFYAPDRVTALSEAHRDVLIDNHDISPEQFWMTRNGLNTVALEYADKNAGKRNPYQLIYASSYDRGLDFVLEGWEKVKEEVPEAELKIYYGWDTYDALMRGRRSHRMKKYKSKIINTIANLDGVQELGRISQNELYKEFAESSFWYYPTAFYEISCINAMTAQATGCIPVCTPYAALNETVNTEYGVKLNREHIVDGLIYNLKHQDELGDQREEMRKWARKEYSMAELAKEWDEYFQSKLNL
jgi:glycosyltransferase involved in cell wall biosynthesis